MLPQTWAFCLFLPGGARLNFASQGPANFVWNWCLTPDLCCSHQGACLVMACSQLSERLSTSQALVQARVCCWPQIWSCFPCTQGWSRLGFPPCHYNYEPNWGDVSRLKKKGSISCEINISGLNASIKEQRLQAPSKGFGLSEPTPTLAVNDLPIYSTWASTSARLAHFTFIIKYLKQAQKCRNQCNTHWSTTEI